ncbi:hypothetical protein F7U66_01320 [Vibrio parahaemolyticus]|nr:hypothetical protein [Vibrio parahaemolyticus]
MHTENTIHKGLVLKLSQAEINNISNEPLLLDGGIVVTPGDKHAISSSSKLKAGSPKRYLGQLQLSESQSSNLTDIPTSRAAIFESKQLEDGYYLAFIGTHHTPLQKKSGNVSILRRRTVRSPSSNTVLFRSNSANNR